MPSCSIWALLWPPSYQIPLSLLLPPNIVVVHLDLRLHLQLNSSLAHDPQTSFLSHTGRTETDNVYIQWLHRRFSNPKTPNCLRANVTNLWQQNFQIFGVGQPCDWDRVLLILRSWLFSPSTGSETATQVLFEPCAQRPSSGARVSQVSLCLLLTSNPRSNMPMVQGDHIHPDEHSDTPSVWKVPPQDELRQGYPWISEAAL